MTRKLRYLVLSLMISALAVSFGLQTSFAEGDVICSGVMSGMTNSSNFNVSRTHFDEGEVVDLSIIGLEDGLAPASRQYAACVDENDDTFPPPFDQYILRGWAWNTNLGFLSFYCDGGLGDGMNEGIPCGSQDYYVEIMPETGPVGFEIRELHGYAWNEAVGYINFYCNGGFDSLGQACGDYDYGVVRDSLTGNLSGYAFSQAGLYLNFDGANMGLPGTTPPSTNWCDGKPYVCLEVTPDPLSADFLLQPGLDIENSMVLADGQEDYTIHLYLRESDGVTPLDTANYDMDGFYDSLDFNWTDTLKIDQRNGRTASAALDDSTTPWSSGLGGVLNKPVSGLVEGDFYVYSASDGHYILDQGVSSYAPSSNGNMALTTSLNPPVLLRNELFYGDYEELNDIERNNLVLNFMNFTLRDSGGDLVDKGPEYPNGRNGLSLKFRPAIELSTLYANDSEDVIVAFRNIPLNFALKASRWGVLNATNASINLFMTYDKQGTQVECGVEVTSPFDIFFLNDLEGNEDTINAITTGVGGVLDLFLTQNDLQAVAQIGEELPCNYAKAPAFYSIVSYVVNEAPSATVHYYSNKLPRIAGSGIANPAAVVHGNVYAQSTFTPSAEVSDVQEAGSINTNIVRDTVKQNLAKYINDLDPVPYTSSPCLFFVQNFGIIPCSVSNFSRFTVGEEEVFYTKGTDLRFQASTWTGDKVVIVEDGNVFIDGDLYNGPGEAGRLSIIVLRKPGADLGDSGNVYIGPGVKNIQAGIVADGAVFSYDGNYGSIDPETGEPDWSGQFRVDVLNNQLFIEGFIKSNNTVGGADADAPPPGGTDPKEYLLLGTGEVILSDDITIALRERAQLYDLNYLRLFRLDIETIDGRPVDQFCQTALSNEQLAAIYSGGEVIGENGERCNGIDVTKSFADDPEGDLIPPLSGDNLAQGLDQGSDFNPIYIFSVLPSSDSFVFTKVAAKSITNF